MAAYGSDSDSDDERAEAPQETGTAAPSPAAPAAPAAAPRPSVSSGLGLPPPRAKARQDRSKMQIRVDASEVPREEKEETQPVKRPRMELADSGAKHSLLSSLPAPQAKPPVKPAEAPSRPAEDPVLEDNALLQVDDTADTPGAKGNDDFRAMLGLKPRAPKPKPKVPVAEQAPAAKRAKGGDTTDAPTGSSAPAPRKRDVPAGFFAPGVEDEAQATSSATPRFSTVSAAPEVDEQKSSRSIPAEQDTTSDREEPHSYPGWWQDPDGSWVPVTPEAHAVYAQWIQAQAAQQAMESAAESSRAEVPRVPRTEPEPEPPGEPDQDVEEPDPLAAISPAIQSNRLTNMRARNRGQLSSLITRAQENRQALEQRWAQGKAKKREASKRYGF